MKFTPKIIILLSIGVLVVIGLLTGLYFVNPTKTEWLPQCFFFRLTGLHCTGCGGTRAVYSLLHGDILTALRCNLLLIPGLITLVLLAVKPKIAFNRHFTFWVLTTIILFSVLRNIPIFPFTLLAPVDLN